MPAAATTPWRWLRSILGRFLDAPETNVAIFTFLLNLTWELAQVPPVRRNALRRALAGHCGLRPRYAR
jgi:hypothetical protein